MRQIWLEGLATTLAKTGNATAASHYSNLLHREQQRREARQIKRATGKQKGSGLLSVTAPTGNGTWEELTVPTDIKKACLEENERQFHQANDTPLWSHLSVQ